MSFRVLSSIWNERRTMLTAEQNEQLTRVGPGTPMGTLLRRYWHPVATSYEVAANPVKAVRILGEALTLFRDRQGRLGLIGQRCAHRRVDLKHGIPEKEGLRCPYHGWMYDASGQCIAQPAEGATHFKDSIKLPSYPVQELGGLIWTYLGPQPAPLLPRWDLFVEEGVFRQIGTTVVPCNWLQCQENAVDTVHTEFAHGRFGLYAMERLGTDGPRNDQALRAHQSAAQEDRFQAHRVSAFRSFVWSKEKRRNPKAGGSGTRLCSRTTYGSGSPDFPSSRSEFRWTIRIRGIWVIRSITPARDVTVPKQDPVPAFDVPIVDMPDYVLGQDLLCWTAQGTICDRTQENLGTSDRGLVMFRRLLLEQIKVVESGGDPSTPFAIRTKIKSFGCRLKTIVTYGVIGRAMSRLIQIPGAAARFSMNWIG